MRCGFVDDLYEHKISCPHCPEGWWKRGSGVGPVATLSNAIGSCSAATAVKGGDDEDGANLLPPASSPPGDIVAAPLAAEG